MVQLTLCQDSESTFLGGTKWIQILRKPKVTLGQRSSNIFNFQISTDPAVRGTDACMVNSAVLTEDQLYVAIFHWWKSIHIPLKIIKTTLKTIKLRLFKIRDVRFVMKFVFAHLFVYRLLCIKLLVFICVTRLTGTI